MQSAFLKQLRERQGRHLSIEQKKQIAAARDESFKLAMKSLEPLSSEMIQTVRPPTVAIVGGGLSGMFLAYLLHGANFKVNLYEASNRFGGRILTLRDFAKDRILEAGAECFGINHVFAMSLAQRFGLKMNSVTPQSQYEAQGLRMPVWVKGKVLTDQEVTDVENEIHQVLMQISEDAKVIQFPYTPWEEDEETQKLDYVSLGEKLKEWQVSPLATQVLEFVFQNNQVAPVEKQSYLWILCTVKGGSLLFKDDHEREEELKEKLEEPVEEAENDNFPMLDTWAYWDMVESFRCSQGNDTLVLEMQKRLPKKALHLNCPITKITQNRDGSFLLQRKEATRSSQKQEQEQEQEREQEREQKKTDLDGLPQRKFLKGRANVTAGHLRVKMKMNHPAPSETRFHADFVVIASPPSTWGSLEMRYFSAADATEVDERNNGRNDGRKRKPKKKQEGTFLDFDLSTLMPSYGPMAKLLSLVRKPFWIPSSLSPVGVSLELGEIWESTDNERAVSNISQEGGSRNNQNLCLTVLCGSEMYVDRMEDAPKIKITKKIEEVYPHYQKSLDQRMRMLWHKTDFIRMGISYGGLGQVTTTDRKLKDPLPEFDHKLLFAGEHTSVAFKGSMEGALSSGFRAAAQIHRYWKDFLLRWQELKETSIREAQEAQEQLEAEEREAEEARREQEAQEAQEAQQAEEAQLKLQEEEKQRQREERRERRRRQQRAQKKKQQQSREQDIEEPENDHGDGKQKNNETQAQTQTQTPPPQRSLVSYQPCYDEELYYEQQQNTLQVPFSYDTDDE